MLLGVNYWMKNLADYADPNIKIVLVGNKADMQDKRVIFSKFINHLCNYYR